MFNISLSPLFKICKAALGRHSSSGAYQEGALWVVRVRSSRRCPAVSVPSWARGPGVWEAHHSPAEAAPDCKAPAHGSCTVGSYYEGPQHKMIITNRPEKHKVHLDYPHRLFPQMGMKSYN